MNNNTFLSKIIPLYCVGKTDNECKNIPLESGISLEKLNHYSTIEWKNIICYTYDILSMNLLSVDKLYSIVVNSLNNLGYVSGKAYDELMNWTNSIISSKYQFEEMRVLFSELEKLLVDYRYYLLVSGKYHL